MFQQLDDIVFCAGLTNPVLQQTKRVLADKRLIATAAIFRFALLCC